MNEDPQFENLLRSLKPEETSLNLRDQVAQDLDLDQSCVARVHRAPRWAVATGWSSLGAAASVAVMGLLSGVADMTNGKPSVVAEDGQQVPASVYSSQQILNATDGGMQRGADESLQQRVKIWSVERHAWVDPHDGAEMTIEIPRQDTLILPVDDRR